MIYAFLRHTPILLAVSLRLYLLVDLMRAGLAMSAHLSASASQGCNHFTPLAPAPYPDSPALGRPAYLGQINSRRPLKPNCSVSQFPPISLGPGWIIRSGSHSLMSSFQQRRSHLERSCPHDCSRQFVMISGPSLVQMPDHIWPRCSSTDGPERTIII